MHPGTIKVLLKTGQKYFYYNPENNFLPHTEVTFYIYGTINPGLTQSYILIFQVHRYVSQTRYNT